MDFSQKKHPDACMGELASGFPSQHTPLSSISSISILLSHHRPYLSHFTQIVGIAPHPSDTAHSLLPQPMHEIKSGNVEMAFKEDGVVIVEGEMRVGTWVRIGVQRMGCDWCFYNDGSS